jgi:hypothetical protein
MMNKLFIAILFLGLANVENAQSEPVSSGDKTDHKFNCAEGEYICMNSENLSYLSCSNNPNLNQMTGQEKTCANSVIDLSRWMSKYGQKSLQHLTLPATHDSGTSNIGENNTSGTCTKGANYTNARAQNIDIAEQLKAGVRLLDIRPLYLTTTERIYSHHGSFIMGNFLGCLGHSFDDILTQIRNFVIANPSEVVILDLSHFRQLNWQDLPSGGDADSSVQKIISDTVVQTLGNAMITPDVAKLKALNIADVDGVKTFLDMKLSDLISFGNVLVVHDGDPSAGIFDQQRGFFALSDIFYNKYSNTNDLSVLENGGKNNDGKNVEGQVAKVWKVTRDSDKYTILAWTLTQSNSQAVMCGISINICSKLNYTIGSLAAEANNFVHKLTDWYFKNHYLPNAVSLDFIDSDLSRAIVFWNKFR